MLITAILGAIGAIGYYVRLYLHKIKKFFGMKSEAPENPAKPEKKDAGNDAGADGKE